MSAVSREATIRWLTHPPDGVPRLTVGSKWFAALPLNLDRTARHPLATAPGELLAGAIGSIFAGLAAEELLAQGTQAHELIACLTLTLSDEHEGATDLALRTIAAQLTGRVPGIDRERLELVARAAMSQSLQALGMQDGGIAVTVQAELEHE